MLQRPREWFCIGLVVLAAIVLLGMPAAQQERLAHSLRAASWGTGQWVFARVIRFARNQEQARHLLAQNVQLAVENMRLRESAEENLRLRQALRFRERSRTGELIPAEVIGRDPDQGFDALIINGGRDLGLQENWPVVTAAGLVGHIQQADAHSAVVRLILDARVSALIHGSRAQGIVSPLQESHFQLLYVDASKSVSAGDRVVSSGMGGRYPKGITIGYVTEVSRRGDDPLFMQILLESRVNFWGLEEVFVLRPPDRGVVDNLPGGGYYAQVAQAGVSVWHTSGSGGAPSPEKAPEGPRALQPGNRPRAGGGALTKADIVRQIAQGTGLTKTDTGAVVDGFIEAVVAALQQGEHIEIRGFGTFKSVSRAPRTGRNPRTGAEVKISRRKAPVFKPSKELRARVGADPSPRGADKDAVWKEEKAA